MGEDNPSASFERLQPGMSELHRARAHAWQIRGVPVQGVQGKLGQRQIQERNVPGRTEKEKATLVREDCQSAIRSLRTMRTHKRNARRILTGVIGRKLSGQKKEYARAK